ncbi:hypothetical protein [Nocardiopsis quinghaiensis]|uniref:hypothetical protein n=1 Tax=Nocardiopsis quinghaiensis TaxID=464995 RepID=UPI00123C56F4|nr:hypothetical protein [Nocardiopsis quinghaiensis]
MADEDADYLAKSPRAGRMGAAAEYLIAATCILATRGELNVSTSLVDDEGVDLVFHRRGTSRTLAVQVKARMSDGKMVHEKELCVAFVRSQTFRPRSDLDLLFAVIDPQVGALRIAWLIPSKEFAAMEPPLDSHRRFRFSASMKTGSRDQWVRFRLSPDQLADRILQRLGQLEERERPE